MGRIWVAAALLGLCACQSEHTLVSGLTQKDANEILVVLDTLQIPAKKEALDGRVVTYSILVSSKLQKQALRALVENHLPKEPSIGLAQVYPPGGAGLIPSRSEENARALMALQGEVENMLKILPGVVNAKVVIVKPDKEATRSIDAVLPKTTASVAIVYNPVTQNGIPSLTQNEIKELLAASVENLDTQNVSVVMSLNKPPLIVGSKEGKQALIAATKRLSASNIETPHMTTLQAKPPATLETPKPSKSTSVAQLPLANKQLLWGGVAFCVTAISIGIWGIARALSLSRKLAHAREQLALLNNPGASHEQHA